MTPNHSPPFPGTRLALVALTDPDWLAAAGSLFSPPDWRVLTEDVPQQILTALETATPGVVLIEDRPESAPVLAAIAAWTGRRREGLCLIVLAKAPDGDLLAAFRHGADLVLDRRATDNATARLAAALSRLEARPGLFDSRSP